MRHGIVRIGENLDRIEPEVNKMRNKDNYNKSMKDEYDFDQYLDSVNELESEEPERIFLDEEEVDIDFFSYAVNLSRCFSSGLCR